MLDGVELVKRLIAIPGPPGQENAVRDAAAEIAREIGYEPTTDAKGNLLVSLGEDNESDGRNTVVVTAHLDEIGLMITRIEADGSIRVAELGGVYAWKWGEGPVEVLAPEGLLPGILSYGGIHTNSPDSVAEFARNNPLAFKQAKIFTGLSAAELQQRGIRPGLRVALARSRRVVTEFGPYIASYFLDDRADLAAWLLALETIKTENTPLPGRVLFAATVSEEVGGEGVRYLLTRNPADICVALEIGPKTPDADFPIDQNPTIWVRDGYAAMEPKDAEILTSCCAELNLTPHWQYLSRGGSDASCAASLGLVARPVTLAFPAENSHGYEIMRRDAPTELARLLVAYLQKL